ncbi:Linearmycin resistance ATP-binding protein LnrL [Phycisphaerales bacterium]|nr:Linearmycin resistance ATP-binding protein LnrL [Phycisphaerales bacterium]
MPPAIELRRVRKTFGTKVAVDDFDLTIEPGTLVGFIGPNGAGKTTTIRMIMSIIFADSGDIHVLGKTSAVESKDRIGYLPEERGLYKKMKVGAFLTYIARLKGMDATGLDRKVRGWLERAGLGDCVKKKCEELSKGMQQKVQFIASVIHEPELLILDEPFSGLDPVNRKLLREMIHEQHAMGRTIIFSTHAMFEAEQLCQRVLMVNRGAKVLDDTLQDIWRKYDPKAVVVEPLTDAPDLLAPAMREIAGVHEAVVTRNAVELRLTDGADSARVMAEAARMTTVRRMELKRPNLEDIFINLVGGSAEAIRAELADLNGAAAAQEASA